MTRTLPSRTPASLGARAARRARDAQRVETAPLVARTRLVRRLCTHLAAGEPVLVQAPCGCGKSVLLEQVAEAAGGVLVRAAAGGVRVFDREGAVVHRRFDELPHVVAAAVAARRPLLVDDADRLDAALLAELCRSATSGLVVSSRTVLDPERLGVRITVNQRALRFDAAELRSLVALHVPMVHDDHVDRVIRSTGGWPAGAAWLLTPELTDEPLDDQLVRECLASLPPHALEAVRAAALLAPCAPAFVDDIAGTADVVDTLVAAQHLVPLLDITLTPSPQVLVGEVVAQLVVAEFELSDPSRLAQLRRTAADTAAARGDHATAHRLLEGEREHVHVARHLYRHGFDLLLDRDHRVELGQWLSRFRHDDHVRWPRLAALHAGLALLRRSVGEAHHWLEVACRPDPLATELGVTPAADIAALIRDDYLCDRPPHTAAVAPAGSQLSAGDVLRSLLQCGRMIRHGDLDRARTALQVLAPQTTRFPLFELARQVHLAMLCHLRLDDTAAAHHLDIADRLADDHDMACAEHLYDAVAAVVRARAGRLETARHHLGRGTRRLAEAPDRTGPGGLMSAVLLLEASIVLDDEERAKDAASHALSALDGGPDAVVLHRRFEQLLVRYSRRFDGSRRSPLARLTRAELSVLRLLDSPMPVPAIAAELSVGPATVRSHVKSIYLKLHVGSRLEAVDVYRRVTGLPTAVIDASESEDDAASA